MGDLLDKLFGGSSPASVVREGGKAAEGVIGVAGDEAGDLLELAGGEARGLLESVGDVLDAWRDDVIELARVPFEGVRSIFAEGGKAAESGVDAVDIAAQAAVTVTLLLLVGLLLYLVL